MNNLRRLYNQNRKGIWWIVLIIAFFLIILRTINYLVAENNKQQLNNTVIDTDIDISTSDRIQLNTQESIISGNKISKNILEAEAGTISAFIENCNNGNLEEAYNMLTDECKEEMYSTVDEFKTFYYANIFEDVRVSFEIENWLNSTYKVDIIPDMLATGKSNNGTVKQDYITVEKVDGDYKLNINNYIGRRRVNKTKEQNGISITVNYSDTYKDYKYYNITVKNNRSNSIILDTLKLDKTMYLKDDRELQYPAYTNEIPQELLSLDTGIERNIEIKYYSRYTTSKTIRSLVFSHVVIDYVKYSNMELDGIENIEISL